MGIEGWISWCCYLLTVYFGSLLYGRLTRRITKLEDDLAYERRKVFDMTLKIRQTFRRFEEDL